MWYRAKDKCYANYDPFAEFEQPSGSHLVIEVERFIVVRSTPKGVILQDWLGSTRIVRGTWINQYAVPTLELALQDLVKRKEKHTRMARLRLEEAERRLALAHCTLGVALFTGPSLRITEEPRKEKNS